MGIQRLTKSATEGEKRRDTGSKRNDKRLRMGEIQREGEVEETAGWKKEEREVNEGTQMK